MSILKTEQVSLFINTTFSREQIVTDSWVKLLKYRNDHGKRLHEKFVTYTDEVKRLKTNTEKFP